MGNRKSTRNSTCTISSCKDHCMQWVYGIMYDTAIFLTVALSSVSVTVTGRRYGCLLCNRIIPALQQRVCVDRIIFMQDGSSPCNANPMRKLLKQDFGNASIISHRFPTTWPTRSSDLTPYEF